LELDWFKTAIAQNYTIRYTRSYPEEPDVESTCLLDNPYEIKYLPLLVSALVDSIGNLLFILFLLKNELACGATQQEIGNAFGRASRLFYRGLTDA
jgi:hypothetical protein